MKWVGQHIWDFVSRFRNDVYLEDISTGTIASGGNLGLDANNKIVKADTEAGELTIANATDNRIVTSLGGTDLNAEATFTYSTVGGFSILDISSTLDATMPFFTLTNTNTGAAGPGIEFVKSADGDDDDTLGTIAFKGDDDGGNEQFYSRIQSEISDATAGQEAGRLSFQVAEFDGTLTEGLKIEGDTNADGEVDVTIGAGVASTTTIAGTLTMGSTAAMTNAGQLSVAAQPNITTMTGFLGGTANALITDDGDGTVTSESSLIYSTSFGTALTMSSTLPVININNTNDDSGGGTVRLQNLRGTSMSALSINDKLGTIQFSGGDSGGVFTNYAMIYGDVRSSNATDEAGRLYLQAATSDGTTTGLQTGVLLTGDPTNNEVDVSIGYGASSITTVNGNLLVEGVTQFNGQLEIGNASDTTLVRSSGGTLTIEGGQVVTAAVPAVSSGSQAPLALHIARRTLNTGEATALHLTPIEIIPAQGANTVIQIVNAVARVDRAATQTNSAVDMNFHYEGLQPGVFGTTSLAHARRFMWNVTTDEVVQLTVPGGGSANVVDLTKDVNKAVDVSFDSAATINCFTSIDIFVTYYVYSIA